MIRPDSYPNSVPGDSNYPLGSMKNITGVGLFDGFPFDKGWMNDYTAFFQRLMTEAGVSPSGIEDTVLVSDLYNSLEILLDLIDDKYLPNNVEKLLLNDTGAAPGTAYVGQGYKGNQLYGELAEGVQHYGKESIGDIYLGFESAGDIRIGDGATGAIEIGSTEGSAATKKLISGAREATFEEIIDAGLANIDGAWQTPTLLNAWAFGGVPLRYKFIDGGKRIRIVGAVSGAAATNIIVFTLPVAYRPSSFSGNHYGAAAGDNNTTDGPIYVSINDSGDIALSLQSNVNSNPTGTCYINETFDLVMP